jgi:transposase InsO family protein
LAADQGGGWEYHFTLAPAEVQARLTALAQAGAPAPEPRSNALWQAFERLPQKAKDEAAKRLAAIDLVDRLSLRAGRSGAVALASVERNVSQSTLYGWLGLVDGVPRADRLPALAPRRQGRTATAACDPAAWDFLIADYLRLEAPRFEACDRRMREAAAEHGWSPKTLKRRLEREIPPESMTVARKGREALKRLYPAQQRDRSHMGPLQAVNIDGHKLDVFVRVEGQAKPTRVILVAIQDLGTGMIVGWNLDLTETRESVRLAIADMVEDLGIPDEMYLDNGRGFASKLISGGQPTRFRFKVRPDEPSGVLTQLGVRCHWTTPYSGQSKPIERAFRDLAEEIARHPVCAGGNTPEAKPENYGSTAIPFEDLEALVAREIQRHNAREGRRGNGMNGRSFLQVWNDKIAAGAIVRRGTEEQRRMLLLASDAITIRRDQPAIWFSGNRYWHEALIEHAGSKVMIRFDPRALFEPIAVYTLDGRFLASADCIEMTGYDDAEKARSHGRDRRAWIKAVSKATELGKRLDDESFRRLLASPDDVQPERPKVERLVVNGRPRQVEDSSFSENFGRGVEWLEQSSVIPFVRRSDDDAR